MTAHHRTRGGQPRLSGRLLRCFGAPQASPELVCCMQPRARQPPAYCCGRPADRATRAGLLGQGAAQVAGVAAQSHQQPTKGDVNLAAAPEERVESRVVAAGRGRRAASGARGGRGWHAHSLLGLLLLPLVYLAVHGVLVLVKQRRLITLVVGACARGRRRVERGARAELGAMGVPWGELARATGGQGRFMRAAAAVACFHGPTQRAPVSGAPSRLSVLASAKVNRSPSSSGHKSVFTSRSRCMS